MPSDSESSSVSANPGWLADVSLLGVALIWGINIPLMKNGLDGLNEWVFSSIRLTFSAGVLALFAWLQRRSGNRPSADLSWRKIVIFGVAVSGVYQICFLVGLARTTSGNTALIICTIPLWTAVLAGIFLAERLKPLAWVGLMLGLAGTTVVALQKDGVGVADRYLLGNVFVLISAVTWSACTVYSRPMLTQISPLQLSAYAAVIALPIHWLIAIPWYGSAVSDLGSVDLWGVIIYSGVLSTGLALPMWNFGVRHAGPSHAAAIQTLVPVVAILAAWKWRAEVPTGPQVFGGALILGGLLLMRASREKLSNPKPDIAKRG